MQHPSLDAGFRLFCSASANFYIQQLECGPGNQVTCGHRHGCCHRPITVSTATDPATGDLALNLQLAVAVRVCPSLSLCGYNAFASMAVILNTAMSRMKRPVVHQTSRACRQQQLAFVTCGNSFAVPGGEESGYEEGGGAGWGWAGDALLTDVGPGLLNAALVTAET